MVAPWLIEFDDKKMMSYKSNTVIFEFATIADISSGKLTCPDMMLYSQLLLAIYSTFYPD